jgi:hypothetical protein
MKKNTSLIQKKALRYISVAVRKKEAQIADEKKTRDYIVSFPTYQLGEHALNDKKGSNEKTSKPSVEEEKLHEARELATRWDFSREQLDAIIEADKMILKAYQAIQAKIEENSLSDEKAYIFSDLLNFARIGLKPEQMEEFFNN